MGRNAVRSDATPERLRQASSRLLRKGCGRAMHTGEQVKGPKAGPGAVLPVSFLAEQSPQLDLVGTVDLNVVDRQPLGKPPGTVVAAAKVHDSNSAAGAKFGTRAGQGKLPIDEH